MFTRTLCGLLLTLSSLVLALWLAWQFCASINFAYGAGYQLLNIEKHIRDYGPTNRFKPDFGLTDPQQHRELFAEIVYAIQHGGDGLDSIEYTTPSGQAHVLLREPEVIHLQDVANLISHCNQITAAMLILGVLALLYYWKSGLRPPNVKQIALGTLSVLAIVGLMLLVVGPTRFFYWFHTVVFPDNHQWFFYYQESLMTTLMKAPDLFGFIAAVWGSMAIILFGLMQFALVKAFGTSRNNDARQK